LLIHAWNYIARNLITSFRFFLISQTFSKPKKLIQYGHHKINSATESDLKMANFLDKPATILKKGQKRLWIKNMGMRTQTDNYHVFAGKNGHKPLCIIQYIAINYSTKRKVLQNRTVSRFASCNARFNFVGTCARKTGLY